MAAPTKSKSSKELPPGAAPVVYTIDEFYKLHRISRGKFYQMVSAGEGPDFMHVGSRRLITVEAAAAWREKLTKRS